jgi:hypothetical protein
MTVTIGSLTFDHATYDDRGDVLYLHIGERQEAADSEATPEGHVLRFNDRGEVEGQASRSSTPSGYSNATTPSTSQSPSTSSSAPTHSLRH